MRIWSSAEYFVGIIAGSIPPCRSLFLQTVQKFIRANTSPPSNKEMSATAGALSNPRSGSSLFFYSLKTLSSSIHNAPFSRSRAPGSGISSGSRRLQKHHIPMKVWNVETKRSRSQDSGRENILPLHGGTSPDSAGIWKTVDVRVGTTSGDDDDDD